MKNAWLKKLVLKVLGEPQIAARYKRAPAAKVMHHAYMGGLIEHVASLCGLAKQIAAHYPELDVDLLLTAAMLHDVGKLDEMSYDRAVQYTPEGELLGHILMGYELVGRKMDAIPGFPAELRTLILHLIASHHGQYEFGSPKLPMFREALVFHYLDELDSRVGAMRRGLEAPSVEGEEIWTGRVAALGRRLLRTERFAAESREVTEGSAREAGGTRETHGAPRAGGPAKGEGK